jgi:hypothetical protein
MQIVISYHVFVTVTKTTEEAGTALPNVVDQGHAEPIAREQATPLGRSQQLAIWLAILTWIGKK